MLTTLFSDASICPDTGCVGWAAWAKSDRGRAVASGVLRRQTIDSAVAEAMAVVNGLAISLRDGVVAAGDTVLVQTDCNGVMGVLRGTTRRGARRAHRERADITEVELREEILRRNEEIDEIARCYERLISGRRLTIVWRHCKAHRRMEDMDARSHVNTACDKRAKGSMRIARTATRRRHQRSQVTALAA